MDYAGESEMIRNDMRTLQTRGRAIEHWLRNEIVPAYDAYRTDPSRGIPLDDVRAGLAERHERTAKRG